MLHNWSKKYLFDKFLLWSSKNFNLAWFNRKDHHGSPEKSLSLSIRELIKKHHGKDFNGPITLLTHLRYFGYVMNPVSFYYCWDKKYQNIKYIVVEINNTPWGEQYCYVLNANDDELFKYWEGLGYYQRVQNLRQACIQILNDYANFVRSHSIDFSQHAFFSTSNLHSFILLNI